jgi:hypothetical protein
MCRPSCVSASEAVARGACRARSSSASDGPATQFFTHRRITRGLSIFNQPLNV